MESLTPIEWQVLEVTAVTPGDLEHLYQTLHVPLADAADAVLSLVEKGILAPGGEGAARSDEIGRLLKSEFQPTLKGHETLAESRPGPPPGWPEGRAYPGMFKGLFPSIPFEVFKRNRQEMSPKYCGDGDDE